MAPTCTAVTSKPEVVGGVTCSLVPFGSSVEWLATGDMQNCNSIADVHVFVYSVYIRTYAQVSDL